MGARAAPRPGDHPQRQLPGRDFAGVRSHEARQAHLLRGRHRAAAIRAGRTYYWIGGGAPSWHPGEGTDFEAIQDGYVSITPLHLDLTHHDSIPRLKPLEELLGARRSTG